MDAWRAVNHTPLDLAGADLKGARLAGTDLGGANLADADLADADLSEANLFGASLVRAKLRGANLAGALMRKCDLRRADLSEANLTGADLENSDLADAVAEKTKLSAANLSSANATGAKLAGADLGAARLKGADLRGAVLTGTVLAAADLQKANLLAADLSGADLSGANLQRAILRDGKPGVIPEPKEGAPPEVRAILKGARLQGADLREADLTGFDFAGADLRDAKLDGACLHAAFFTGADLGGTHLEDAILTDCDFMGVRFDSLTLLRRARVKGAKVDRHTLESLKDYGGLTPGDRMQMKILDGVSLLRSHYSGFWQYIHLFALVLFAYPYAWFVFFEYGWAHAGAADMAEKVRVVSGTAAHEVEAKMKSNPFLGGAAGGEEKYPLPRLKERQEIPIWKGFCQFVWNGGKDWQKGFRLDRLSFGLFVFSFLYNLTRFVMVFKTKELELQQETTGLPVPVSALGFWGRMVHIMEIGFCINVVVVLVHTFHFLQHPIVLYLEKQ